MQTGVASATEVFVERVAELRAKWAFSKHVFTSFSVRTDFAHTRSDFAVLWGGHARRRLRAAHGAIRTRI